MIRAARSELVRLRRLWLLPAIAVVLGIVATVLQFSGGASGPRGATSSVADPAASAALAAPDGIVAGLGLAANFAGLLTLVLWALSIARDLQTGTIRVLLVTQARRSTYLGGKVLALAAVTTITAIVTVGTSVAAAYLAAAGTDTSTAAWSWSNVGSALANLSVATLTWGAIGAALAMTTRSSAASIATGIGYLLLGENLIAMLWSSAGDWLPAGALADLVEPSTAHYAQALLIVAGYLAAATTIAFATLSRRDITD